jgi:hypothetical protein
MFDPPDMVNRGALSSSEPLNALPVTPPKHRLTSIAVLSALPPCRVSAFDHHLLDPSPMSNEPAKTGLRILSLGMFFTRKDLRRTAYSGLPLDGDGISVLSELTMLRELMYRIMTKLGLSEMPRPCDWFHVIGGTGTGG